jgi:hypothetical protein
VEADGGLPVVKVDCFRRLKWTAHQSHINNSVDQSIKGGSRVNAAAQNHVCHAERTKNQNSLNCKRSSSYFCSIFRI